MTDYIVVPDYSYDSDESPFFSMFLQDKEYDYYRAEDFKKVVLVHCDDEFEPF